MSFAGSAKVLQEASHHSEQIFVQACDSWNQPKPQQIDADDATNEPSLLQLNDDCLEYIFKLLVRLGDPLQLARVCPRLRDVFQVACKSEYNALSYYELINPYSCERHEFFELVGPIVETMYMTNSLYKYRKRPLMLVANICPNLKSVIFATNQNLHYLPEFLEKEKSLTNLELKDCSLSDDDILAITQLTHLESLTLSKSCGFKGIHLDKLTNVKTLDLSRCSEVEPTYFISMCKSLKELKSLDIRQCRLLLTNAINKMAIHCQQLEILKMSRGVTCVTRLPKLKSLHINEYLKQPFVAALAAHAQQLEYLTFGRGNWVTIGNEIAALIGRLKSLRQLTWGSHWPNVQKPENLKISECVPNLSNLRSVQIQESKPLGRVLFAVLAEHAQHLEHLIIYSKNWITYDIVELIARLRMLKQLVCSNNSALDSYCLRKLAELKNLEEINVSSCASFKPEGLLFLIGNCPKLRHVHVEFCEQISDEFLPKVSEVLNQRQEQPKKRLMMYVFGASFFDFAESRHVAISFRDPVDNYPDAVSMDSDVYDDGDELMDSFGKEYSDSDSN